MNRPTAPRRDRDRPAPAARAGGGGHRGHGAGPRARRQHATAARHHPARRGTRRRPAGSGPLCAGLLTSLNGDLPAAGGTLPQRAQADPAQPGVRAWAASPRPVVLRCGLPRPAELTPTSALLVVNGVNWLKLDDGVPDPVTLTYVAVDRPVYVALTTPTAVGGGPLQQVSDVVRTTLPTTPVAVR